LLNRGSLIAGRYIQQNNPCEKIFQDPGHLIKFSIVKDYQYSLSGYFLSDNFSYLSFRKNLAT